MVGPGGEEKVGDLEGSGEGVGKRVEGCAGAGGGGRGRNSDGTETSRRDL